MIAVIFDLFDTLVSEPPGRPSQQHVATSLRVSLDDLRQWWRDTARKRMTGEYPSYLSSLEAMRRDLGSQATDSELRAVAADRYRRKRDILLRVEARIVDMIKALACSGLPEHPQQYDRRRNRLVG